MISKRVPVGAIAYGRSGKGYPVVAVKGDELLLDCGGIQKVVSVNAIVRWIPPIPERLDSWWGFCPDCGLPPTDVYKHRYQIAFCEPCLTQWGVAAYRKLVEAGEP